MKDIRDILNESEIVFNIAMAVSFVSPDIYYIFRNNGEQVEVDIKNKVVSHQLTFSEMKFIDDNYPLIRISTFLIRKKVFI